MLRSKLAQVLIVVLATTIPSPALAQWATSRSGEATYQVNYTTYGLFSCYTAYYLPPAICQTNGGFLSYTNDTGTFTVNFTGYSGSALTPARDVVLGQFVTEADAGFQFPDVSAGWRFFSFDLIIETGLTQTSGNWGHRYFSQGGEFVGATDGYSTAVFFSLPPHPDGLNLPTLVFDGMGNPTLGPNSSHTILATASTIPEPNTLILLASGMIGLLLFGFRRRGIQP